MHYAVHQRAPSSIQKALVSHSIRLTIICLLATYLAPRPVVQYIGQETEIMGFCHPPPKKNREKYFRANIMYSSDLWSIFRIPLLFFSAKMSSPKLTELIRSCVYGPVGRVFPLPEVSKYYYCYFLLLIIITEAADRYSSCL